jgi:hypothetical protein
MLRPRDYETTEIDADIAPGPTQGAMWAQRAFGAGAVTIAKQPAVERCV